ncbi:serine/threonine protein kinase [Polymorphospora sp. NPDC051019]|uniref:serine/threonine protein kinase n=1 Tax=Polymorphospora sp. NPDC051019 TaxID=3155725 RepID=UPI0034131A70
MTTVAEAIRLVMSARDADDLFGDADPARRYRDLARVLHPDRRPAAGTGPDAATEAFVRLSGLWQDRRRVVIRTRRDSYRLTGSPTHRGDLADLYDVGADRLLKLPRDPANNDLMAREARALRALADRGDPRFLPYVPRLVDTFQHTDTADGTQRRVNVVAAVGNLHSLAEVRRRRPDGLDARDAAWMWRRLLTALGLAHRAGVVHGAVLPEHVLIEPDAHGVVLVDWCYSASDEGERIPALVPAYADWYPVEVTRRERPGPATDIAMASRCMAHLMGDLAPPALRRFVAGCTLPSPRQRPDDAWRLLDEFDDVLADLYGPRTFRPFTL